jgi:predicted TIM-barrel fold metal-dependent hydrolase
MYNLRKERYKFSQKVLKYFSDVLRSNPYSNIMKKTEFSSSKRSPKQPRRKFLQNSAALFTGALSAAAAGNLGLSSGGMTAGKKRLEVDNYQIFDCHLHCPSESGELIQWYKVTHTFEDFVAYLDKTDVRKGILASQRSLSPKPEEFIAGNREVARFAEKYKDRFIGACGVNPLFPEESLKEIEYCRNQLGFVWVGELCNYVVPYDYSCREFELLVDHVVKLNMVLALHTEQGEMEYIAGKFPQAIIAFAHFGDDNEYADIFKRIKIVAGNPNYYLDTSGYGHDRVGVLEYAVETIGPDRILFGSDFSINDPSTVIARIKNSFLTQEQKQKIFSGNLQALLKRVQIHE